MDFYDVFYFHAHLGGEVDGDWKEFDEYGFVVAKNFNDAMAWISNQYRSELMSVSIEYIGDTGIVSCESKEAAEAFKKSYTKCHYGEEEE